MGVLPCAAMVPAHEDELFDAIGKSGSRRMAAAILVRGPEGDQRQLARVLAREAQQGGNGVFVLDGAR